MSPWVDLAGCVPSFGVGILGIFGTSHVRHDLLSTTSISGGYFCTSVGMQGAPKIKRGRGTRAKPVLLGLWVALADYGTCFVSEGGLANTS